MEHIARTEYTKTLEYFPSPGTIKKHFPEVFFILLIKNYNESEVLKLKTIMILKS